MMAFLDAIFVVIVGLLGSSYSFYIDIPVIGLFFIIIMIIGFLMNPPTVPPETESKALQETRYDGVEL